MTKSYSIERMPVGEREAIYVVVDADGETVGAHSLRRQAVAARDYLNGEVDAFERGGLEAVAAFRAENGR